jgi:exopolysaccharide biosynthesis protein
MRHWFLLVIFCGALAWGATRWLARGDEGWATIAPGVEMRTLRAPGEQGKGSVVALRVEPSRVKIAVGAAREAEEWRKTGGALLAVNGGYYDAEGKSLGLRVANGRKISRLHGKVWGVFYTRRGRASIVPTSDFVWKSGIREAVQCGPRLVENGQVLKLKNQWARRTGIGVTREGKVVIAVADGEVSLPDWAKLWAARGGLNCVDALNLDGGPSSQLSLQTSTRRLHLRTGRAVPDAVLIK